MNNTSVSNNQLEYINECLVLLTIDMGPLVMALQAMQVDCAVSKGVINTVIMALSDNVDISEELNNQLDSLLSLPQKVTGHE